MTDSTRNVAQSQDVVLDPNFFLPPNVVDLRYVNDKDTDGVYTDEDYEGEDVLDGEPLPAEEPVIDLGSTSPIMPPTNITIVSQTVRVLGGGGYVVDVEIEVEDSDGADYYETRISK